MSAGLVSFPLLIWLLAVIIGAGVLFERVSRLRDKRAWLARAKFRCRCYAKMGYLIIMLQVYRYRDKLLAKLLLGIAAMLEFYCLLSDNLRNLFNIHKRYDKDEPSMKNFNENPLRKPDTSESKGAAVLDFEKEQ